MYLCFFCSHSLIAFFFSSEFFKSVSQSIYLQGVFEMRVQILTTSYWLHVELGKNMYLKNSMSKNKGKILAHFKNTPYLSYFIKRTPIGFPCFKAYFLEVTSHWRTFYKICMIYRVYF
jgi:hypothetical protein